MQGYPERFEDGHRGGAETVGHGVKEGGRPGHVLAQASIGGTVPGKAHIGAQVGVAFPAPRAMVAGYSRVHRHPAPVETASLHRPTELVAEDQGPVQHGVPDAALAEPVQVRPAQSHRRDPHQALARPRLGARLFDHLKLTEALQPHCSHRHVHTPPLTFP